MKIRITGWRYENLRIGAGTEEVNLGNPPKRWSLVQMPNGTGKTSTMTLIRAVLGAQEFSAEEILSFRADDDVDTGLFELSLLIENGGGSEVEHRLTAHLDFATGGCRYSTMRPATLSGGREDGRVLPPGLAHLLRPDFIKLFVFDGELARDIRQTDKGAADRAIKTLYQLTDIATLRLKTEELVKAKQDAAARSMGRTQKAVSQARNAVERAKTQVGHLEADLADKNARASHLKTEAEEIRKDIDAHLARNRDLEDRRNALSKEADGLKSEIQMAARTSLDAFRNPARLSPLVKERMAHLGAVLTEARLPKSPASEFFAEIADQGVCICGTTIGEKEREALAANRDRYLAHDQIHAIATMKTRLSASPETETGFVEASSTLQDRLEDQTANQRQRALLEQEAEERGDTDLGELRQRAGANKEQLDSLKKAISLLAATDHAKQELLGCTASNNLALAKVELAACDETLKEVSQSYQLSQRRDRLISQLSRIEARALDGLRDTIRDDTNQRLETLVRMEELRVARIDGALELTSNKVERRENVSEGQSLSVAYAFLTSLLSKAPFELPFLVDSPAVSLDLDVRAEVARILPELFDQMILFVISSEEAGFAETFYDSEDAHFVSFEKNAEGEIVQSYGLEAFKRRAAQGDVL